MDRLQSWQHVLNGLGLSTEPGQGSAAGAAAASNRTRELAQQQVALGRSPLSAWSRILSNLGGEEPRGTPDRSPTRWSPLGQQQQRQRGPGSQAATSPVHKLDLLQQQLQQQHSGMATPDDTHSRGSTARLVPQQPLQQPASAPAAGLHQTPRRRQQQQQSYWPLSREEVPRVPVSLLLPTTSPPAAVSAGPRSYGSRHLPERLPAGASAAGGGAGLSGPAFDSILGRQTGLDLPMPAQQQQQVGTASSGRKQRRRLFDASIPNQDTAAYTSPAAGGLLAGALPAASPASSSAAGGRSSGGARLGGGGVNSPNSGEVRLSPPSRGGFAPPVPSAAAAAAVAGAQGSSPGSQGRPSSPQAIRQQRRQQRLAEAELVALQVGLGQPPQVPATTWDGIGITSSSSCGVWSGHPMPAPAAAAGEVLPRPGSVCAEVSARDLMRGGSPLPGSPGRMRQGPGGALLGAGGDGLLQGSGQGALAWAPHSPPAPSAAAARMWPQTLQGTASSAAAAAAAGGAGGGGGDSVAVLANAVGQLTTLLEQMLHGTPAGNALAALPAQPPASDRVDDAVPNAAANTIRASADKEGVGGTKAVSTAHEEDGAVGSARESVPGVAGQQKQQQQQQQQQQGSVAGIVTSSRHTSAAGAAAAAGAPHLAQQMQRQWSAASAGYDQLDCMEGHAEGPLRGSHGSGSSMQEGQWLHGGSSSWSAHQQQKQQQQHGGVGSSQAPADLPEHSSRRGSSSSDQALTPQADAPQATSSSSSRRGSNAGSSSAAATPPIAPGPQGVQAHGGAGRAVGAWEEGDQEAASPAVLRSQSSQEHASGEADETASTPAAVLRGPRGPACSDQEVLATAEQLTTPMLANSSCAVVELSAAWRTEAAQTQEGWQSLLQEWEAEGGSISGTPSAGGAVAAAASAGGAAASDGAGMEQQQQQEAAAAADAEGHLPATEAPGDAGVASPLQACAVSPGLSECSEVSLAVSAARHLAASRTGTPHTAAGGHTAAAAPQAAAATAAAAEVLSPLKPVAFDFGALEEGGDNSPQPTWSGSSSRRSSSNGHGSGTGQQGSQRSAVPTPAAAAAEVAAGGQQLISSRSSDNAGVAAAGGMTLDSSLAQQLPRFSGWSMSSGGGAAVTGDAGSAQLQEGGQLVGDSSQTSGRASSGDMVSQVSSSTSARDSVAAAAEAGLAAAPGTSGGGSSSSAAGPGSSRGSGAGVALESPAAQAASLEARMLAMYQQLRAQQPLMLSEASQPPPAAAGGGGGTLHQAGSSSGHSTQKGPAAATAAAGVEPAWQGGQGVQAGAAILSRAKAALHGSALGALLGAPSAAAGACSVSSPAPTAAAGEGGSVSGGGPGTLTAAGSSLVSFAWLSPKTAPLSSSRSGTRGAGASSSNSGQYGQQQQQQGEGKEVLSSRSAILSSLKASAARLSSPKSMTGLPGPLASTGQQQQQQQQGMVGTGGSGVASQPLSPTLAALLAAPTAAAAATRTAAPAVSTAGASEPLTTPRAVAGGGSGCPLAQRWGTPPTRPLAATPPAAAAAGTAAGGAGMEGVSPWLQSRSVQHVLQRADVDALGADLARLRAQLAARRPSAVAAVGGAAAGAGVRSGSAAATGRTPLQQQQRPPAAASTSSWRGAVGAEGGVSPLTPAAARPLAALLHNNSSSTPVGGAAAAGSSSSGYAYQTWPARALDSQQQHLVGAGNRSSSSLYVGAAASTPITPIASSSSISWAGAAATADAPRQRPLQSSNWRGGARTHGEGVTVNRQAARQFDQHMRQLHSATANMRAHTGASDAAAGATAVAAAGGGGVSGSPYSHLPLGSSSMSNPGYEGALVPAAAGASSWAGVGASAVTSSAASGHSRSQQLQVLASHLELDAEHMRAEAAQQHADAVLQRDAMRDRRPPSPTLLEKWAREGSPTRHRRQQERKQAAAAGAFATAVSNALYNSGSSSSVPGASLSPWRPVVDAPQVLSVERVQETLSNVLQLQAATATAARQGPVQVGGGGRGSPTALMRRHQAGLSAV